MVFSAVLRSTVHNTVENIPDHGFSLTHIFPYNDKIEDSDLSQENTGQRKLLFWYEA